jgi:hypothetical protein
MKGENAMSIRSTLTTAALVAALISCVLGSTAFADEREENVYPDMIAAQQPRVTVWDLMQGRDVAASGERQEARSAAQTATDAGFGASIPALSPHTYDYLAGPSIPAGG